jgi:hypothetical protein
MLCGASTFHPPPPHPKFVRIPKHFPVLFTCGLKPDKKGQIIELPASVVHSCLTLFRDGNTKVCQCTLIEFVFGKQFLLSTHVSVISFPKIFAKCSEILRPIQQASILMYLLKALGYDSRTRNSNTLTWIFHILLWHALNIWTPL